MPLTSLKSAQLFPNPIRFYQLCKPFKSCDKKAQLIPSNRWVVSHRAAHICGNVRAREEKAPPVVWKKTTHTMQQLISYPISGHQLHLWLQSLCLWHQFSTAGLKLHVWCHTPILRFLVLCLQAQNKHHIMIQRHKVLDYTDRPDSQAVVPISALWSGALQRKFRLVDVTQTRADKV